MLARINTRLLNVERINVNRPVSNNNESINQAVEENDNASTTMTNKEIYWERNVGQLIGEVNDGHGNPTLPEKNGEIYSVTINWHYNIAPPRKKTDAKSSRYRLANDTTRSTKGNKERR